MTAVAAPPVGRARPSGRAGRRHPLSRGPLALAVVVAPLFVAALAISALGVATVRHDSMAPTLGSGDVVVYDRWSEPARGDIVLLVDREGWSGEAGALLVKRIVGVAGDVVVCCEAGTGRLVVNGMPADEPYAGESRPGGGIPFRVTVPEGAVWVMGDNRGASTDSRASVSEPSRGAVLREDLRGTVRGWWG